MVILWVDAKRGEARRRQGYLKDKQGCEFPIASHRVDAFTQGDGKKTARLTRSVVSRKA